MLIDVTRSHAVLAIGFFGDIAGLERIDAIKEGRRNMFIIWL